ncbi:MAG: hypothetical protein HC926_05690 [Synechococcaceae cyanobacterium SM2_3_60]|nr:hypothetical protein [Synechococcaceae cyanobacterium SM2_3_60]
MSRQTTPLDAESFGLAVGMGRGMMAMGAALALSGQAELVAASETVNGVTVDHYRLIQDDANVALDTDIWLSQTGGYVVKLASRTTIPNTLEMRTTIDLSEVNSLAAIAIPAVCTP